MKTDVRWSAQVAAFVSALSPESKKKLRAGIR